MEVIKHLHQKPGRMKRTGALQAVEETGPAPIPVVEPKTRPIFLEREDDFLRRRYCVDLGPKECCNALNRTWTTVIKRAQELDIDHRRETWKSKTESLRGWRRQAAERLGVIENESADLVQPYRPDYLSGPTWVGFESSPCRRPGGDDHAAHPSRIGNTLVYRDGRRVEVSHVANPTLNALRRLGDFETGDLPKEEFL